MTENKHDTCASLSPKANEVLMHNCLDIAALAIERGQHQKALIALVDAGRHYGWWCWLQNKAAAEAEGNFDHEPMWPDVEGFIEQMGSRLYQLHADGFRWSGPRGHVADLVTAMHDVLGD